MDWTPDKWSESLWNYFLPQIKSGQPVYFSIDQALLLKLTLERDSSRSDEPVEHLARCCHTLVDVKGPTVQLRRSALNLDIANKYSNIICLVALQIVTADSMSEDELYTGNAYFPRLRRLLGCAETTLHPSDPFVFGEFEEIWNIFKDEILCQPGASAKTITFKKGYGRDIRRALPLSQALLTAQELTKLYERLPSDGKRITSEKDAFSELLRNRPQISDRSKRIVNSAINIPHRRTLLGEQLLNFLKNPKAINSLYEYNTKLPLGSFSAYWSADIINPDLISIYWIDDEGKEIPEQTFEKIIHHCSDDKYLIFTEENSEFIFRKTNREITEDDGILFICPHSKQDIIQYTLDQYSNEEIRLDRIDCDLPNGFIALFSELPTSIIPIVIHNSKLIVPGQNQQRAPNISLSGGMIIDGRKREYLAPYFPKHFIYGGMEIDDNDFIKVDGERTTLGDFKAKLFSQSSSYRAHHLITYNQSQIAFSTCIENSPSRYMTFGYIYSDGKLSPKLTPVDESIYFLSGIQLSLPYVFSSPNRRQLKELIAAISIMTANRHHPGFKVPRKAVMKSIEYAFESRAVSGKIKNSLISDTQDQIEISPVAMYILNPGIAQSGYGINSSKLTTDELR